MGASTRRDPILSTSSNPEGGRQGGKDTDTTPAARICVGKSPPSQAAVRDADARKNLPDDASTDEENGISVEDERPVTADIFDAYSGSICERQVKCGVSWVVYFKEFSVEGSCFSCQFVRITSCQRIYHEVDSFKHVRCFSHNPCETQNAARTDNM